MSPLASFRIAAVLLSLLAFGCQLGLRLLHRANPTVSAVLFDLVAFVTLALIAAAYFAVIAPYRRPAATFTRTPGQFAASSSPYAGLYTVALGWIAGHLIALPAAAALAFAAGLLLFLPKVALTPTHLVVRHLWTRRFAWEHIGPECAANRRGAIEFEFFSASGKWRSVTLGARTRDVDSAFLARAIEEYADHPEHRAQIGTAEELERLKALPPKAIEETTEAWPKWLAGEGEQA